MPKIQLLTIVWLQDWYRITVTRLYYCITIFLMFCLACLSTAYGQQDSAGLLRVSPVVRAIQRSSPAVVNISGRKPANRPQQLFDGSDNEVNGMGTGLVIDPRGYILTNHHVIAGIDRIQVRLSRTCNIDIKDYAAQIIAVDSPTDLAVIKIESDIPLPVIELATSSDLMLGETVIAIGNAYGYEDTITKGIISCLQRQVQVTEEQVYRNLIQTDASINPGNSGGPLINIQGEAIGINVAVRVGAQAIGFAIPMDRAMEITTRILKETVERRLASGIEVSTEVEKRNTYVRVANIKSGSLGALAGLKEGDQIIKFGDRELNWGFQLYINILENGFTPSTLKAKRAEELMTLPFAAKTNATQDTLALNRAWSELGLRVSPISFRSLPGKNKYAGGLKVLQVRNQGPANQQGIRAGDVLLAIHKWETLSLDNLEYILNSEIVASRRPVTFYIYRETEFFFGEFFKE